MNRVPPNPDPPDEVDEQYRRLSALDPSRPSEAVRQSVLDHAARVAAARAVHRPGLRVVRSAAQWAWRRPAIFGPLAAAVIAGLVIAPLVLTPRTRPGPDVITGEGALARPAETAVRQATEVRAHERESPPPPGAPSAESPRLAAAQAPTVTTRATGRAKAPAEAPAEMPAAAPAAPPAAADEVALQEAVAPFAARATPSRAAAARSATGAQPEAVTDAAAAFRRAAAAGDLAALEALRGKQPDVDARDSQGRTALMLATLHGQTDAVSALLGFGADPNAADASGTTPLQAAAAEHREGIAALLQRHGAR